MTITERSSLATVALLVGDALRRRGIAAVLTGGACASLHTRGAFHSLDVDFVLTSEPDVQDLDSVLASLGFRREGNRYVHSRSRYFVEFPRGPLAVGRDRVLRPARWRRGDARMFVLSATDSCRDRLAAFYHWSDRQSLAVAAQIAVRNRVDMTRIRAWSEGEGHAVRFEEFRAEVARRRRGRAGHI